jgi:hypothetical protein
MVDIGGKMETFGCWCFTMCKNVLPVNCWLWERNAGGWPNDLNSDYERTKHDI